MLAAQGILTYGATPTLPYSKYADEWELLVLTAPLTSFSLSKKQFFDKLKIHRQNGLTLKDSF